MRGERWDVTHAPKGPALQAGAEDRSAATLPSPIICQTKGEPERPHETPGPPQPKRTTQTNTKAPGAAQPPPNQMPTASGTPSCPRGSRNPTPQGPETSPGRERAGHHDQGGGNGRREQDRQNPSGQTGPRNPWERGSLRVSKCVREQAHARVQGSEK